MVVSSDQQQQQPTAFPRGKRKKSTLSVNNNNDSNKKQRATTTTSSSSTTTGNNIIINDNNKEPSDFLFGNETAISNAIAKKKKFKQHHDQPDGYELEDDEYHTTTTTSSSSSLPLGGGAVLPPSTTPSGKYIPCKIEPLSFTKFHVGTKVLGIVRDVTTEYAVISLCTMLTGFVKRDSSSPDGNGSNVPLTSVMSVGSIMTFYVLSTEEEVDTTSKRQQLQQQGGAQSVVMTKKKKRRIELSMWPTHVNSGLRLDAYLLPSTSSSSSSSSAHHHHQRDNNSSSTSDITSSPMVVRGRIISIEDHGCLVDLGGILNTIPSSSGSGGGVSVKQAFLKFDNVEGEYEIVDNDNDDDDSSSDEEESEDEDKTKDKMDTASSDKSSSTTKTSNSSYKHRLNPNRVYDFTILPSNIINTSSSSSSSSSVQLPSIIQLGLPTPTSLATYYTTSNMVPTLSTLQPGMLIKDVSVEAFAKNGLCVTFNNGVYRGCLDEDHLGGHRGVTDEVTEEGGESGSVVGMKSKSKNGMKKGGEGDVTMSWRRLYKGKFSKVSKKGNKNEKTI